MINEEASLSGGPFVVNDNDRFILVGILHGAFTACSGKYPTIFTRIDDASILPFIRMIVFNEDLETLLPNTQGKMNFKCLSKNTHQILSSLA